MRASILFWSTLSGVLLALFVALLLLGCGVLLHAVVPGAAARFLERWRSAAFVVLFVLLPLAGAIAGFLEGRLKLR